MTTLRLYLRAGWPDSEPGLPWALLGARGEVSAQGDGAPAGWPRADRCELILPAGRTLFTQARLPDAVKQPTAAVLGFALEEGLINDPAANLYAVGAVLPDGRRAVAVTEAFPVRRAVAMLKSAGRLCDRILPEESLLPLPARDGWSVARGADGWLLRLSAARAIRLPYCGELAEQLLFARLAAEWPPASLSVCGADAALVGARLPAWQGEPRQLAAHDWCSGQAQQAFDFANGDLAANRRWRDWGPALRRSGLALGGLLAAQLALTLGQAGWYAWQKQSLSADIRAAAKPWIGGQAMPGSSALAMTRAVDKLRLSHGLPARDDALELMGALAALSGRELQTRSLSYDSGRLKLQVAEVPADTLQRWRSQLAAQQIRLDVATTQQGTKELSLSREP
ncbi:type II secretion system protein GspL [Chromobacterium aquaticum]|uniref:Type II secretion system protein GspL n=2 Tax=Chromobacterium aquaticum TaxID=467180 RepID=A0ABV8ZNQ4_9NEIS